MKEWKCPLCDSLNDLRDFKTKKFFNYMNHTFISFGLNWTFCKLIVVLLSTETLGVASRSRGKVCRLSARGFWVWHHQETVGRAQGTSLTLHLCLNLTWWSLHVSATISWLIITCMDILWLGCRYFYNLRGTCLNLSPVFPAKKMFGQVPLHVSIFFVS